MYFEKSIAGGSNVINQSVVNYKATFLNNYKDKEVAMGTKHIKFATLL